MLRTFIFVCLLFTLFLFLPLTLPLSPFSLPSSLLPSSPPSFSLFLLSSFSLFLLLPPFSLSSFLPSSSINLELRTNTGSTALWLALTQLNSMRGESDRYAARLIERGANPNAIDSITGNSLLHQAALESNERAAIFLVCHSAEVDHVNHQGESPMHVAAAVGLHNLVQVLLQYGADPNLQTNLKKKTTPTISIALKTVAAESPPVSRGSPDLMSPTSTLGALSVLSNIASTSPSLGMSGKHQLMQLSSLSSATGGGSSPLIGRSAVTPTSSNPFGDDSDEDDAPPTRPQARTSGYSFVPSGSNTPRSSPVISLINLFILFIKSTYYTLQNFRRL